MAFKMTGPPYSTDNTPIYSTDMDDNVLGMAQSNGTILVNKNVSPLELKKNKTIEHEKVHIDQMKRGDLDYSDTHVFWKGKKYLRASMKEGAKNLPWEKEAYSKQGNQSPFTQTKKKIVVNTVDSPVIDPDFERAHQRHKTNEFVKKLNPKITDKQLNKTWKNIYSFDKLNKK